jgi:hypothetical protein
MNNNTFSRAESIGRISSAGGLLQGKGLLNAADRVDIYQYRVQAGSAFTVRSSFNPRSGSSFDLGIYYKDRQTGKTKSYSGTTIRIEGNDTINIATPSLSRTVTFYLKLSNPRGEAKYDFKLQAVR